MRIVNSFWATTLAAFLCGTLYAPAFAATKLDSNSDPIWTGKAGWSVYSYPDEDMCEAAKVPILGEYFTFAYFPKEKSYGLVFSNSNATSLNHDQNVKLMIVLGVKGNVDLSWGESEFSVIKSDKMVAFQIFLSSPIEKDIQRSDSITLFRLDSQGKPVAVSHVNLSGSGPAVSEVIRCAIEAAELNASDPFLK